MKIIFLFLLLVCGSVHAIKPSKIVVVVDDKQKQQLIGVSVVRNYLNSIDSAFKIYSINDVEHFEEMLSEGLSKVEAIAEKQMHEKLKQIGEEELSEKAKEAYQAQFHILKYGIMKKPAIIIDDKYVIYGELDLNKAINFYLDME